MGAIKRQAPFPDTFLIGVQKAGTTTLNDWIGQHPQVYCYNSLKDIPLFIKYPQPDQLNRRLLLESPPYNGQPVVFHSAVNYIFYPSLIQQLAQRQPGAKLIVVLRNPVIRAISSYFYFRKMLREHRDIETALLYHPEKKIEITRDNNDFTYIEHGLYSQQIKNCLEFFPGQQLLVLDYEELTHDPKMLLAKVFRFLNIDEKFIPNLNTKNVTGELKSKFLQQEILKKNTVRKWVVDRLVDPWLPVTKRKLLKNRMLELNTAKQKQGITEPKISEQILQKIESRLREFYIQDTALLDKMLNTDFYSKWFSHKVISKN
ncbi:MAG TPA: sulfotransferase domain-containing protein [Parafilimonas sp.]|nr:sulfotransferase domain-containing protein [Parafilimonas sp.]